MCVVGMCVVGEFWFFSDFKNFKRCHYTLESG